MNGECFAVFLEFNIIRSVHKARNVCNGRGLGELQVDGTEGLVSFGRRCDYIFEGVFFFRTVDAADEIERKYDFIVGVAECVVSAPAGIACSAFGNGDGICTVINRLV